ncbi:MAG: hypothetical protein E7670_04345 [Ruminococcaceae bacterium]|nr:hypothetical protein [Oscillospiraceae bacterium]
MKYFFKNERSDDFYYSIVKDTSKLPFDFCYGKNHFSGFSENFFSTKSKNITKCGEKETVEWRFLYSEELEATLKLTHYFDYGVTEWTVGFENNGECDSEVISNTKTTIEFEGERPVLKGIMGDHVNAYSPYTHDLSLMPISFSSDIGRATHVNFPYFNLEYGSGGCMLAIGWAGTWSASFDFDGESTKCSLRSVNNINTKLHAGEKIRTALFVIAPYTTRDEYFATNFWRRWFIKYNMPKADRNGNAITPFSTSCLASDTGKPNFDGSISEDYTTWRPSLKKMIAENVKVDFRWFDAGWYPFPDGTSSEWDWWNSIGSWELDPQKWPDKTFLESTDFARENGMKTLMWFEPERVTHIDDLVKYHGYKREWAIESDLPTHRNIPDHYRIANNIGNPECFEWTVSRICKTLRENKVELYREDNNFNPALLWPSLDEAEGKDRRGISECKFIDAHYRMWDRIIECTGSYGGCSFVDSCASGGGRNDIESLRRGIPLLRSDSDRTSTALRLSMTSSFNKWIPFCGANTKEKIGQLDATGISDTYVWRASYLPALNVDSQYVQDPDMDFDMLRFGLNEWKNINRYLLKDFYVLTPWHYRDDKTGMTAFCYHDDADDTGILLAFRREECGMKELTIRIPFAEAEKTYVFTDEDTKEVIIAKGSDALKMGFVLSFDNPRTSKLLRFEVK